VTGPAAAQVAVPIGLVRGGETVLEIDARDPLTVPLAPLRLVTGGRLLVSAEARDACTLAGGPNVGTSDTWTLDVVTPDELRALLETREILLRRRFEAAIDDLARARERLAAIAGAAVGAGGVEQTGDVVAQCGEAATRGAGETAEIGAAFQGIGLELSNNDLLSADLEARIVAGIARPLAEIGSRDLPDVAKACRQVAGGPAADPEAVGRRADAAIARMREVLAKMMEAESVNEIVERLRNLLRTQEAIRAETIEIQKRQAREALERP
jgi:outer membrane murein-binding lipoprotein Lpp